MSPLTVTLTCMEFEFEPGRPLNDAASDLISDQALTSAGFAQRVKALATTAPLHDLDARKAQVQSADYTVCTRWLSSRCTPST